MRGVDTLTVFPDDSGKARPVDHLSSSRAPAEDGGVSPVGLRIVANRRVDGTALRKARLKAGLTMSEVAEAVGVADGARIGAWEHGLEQPHPRFIPKLAKVVKLPVTALLVGKGLEPSLADLRLTKGLTLTELAASAGIPRTTCHRLEQGFGTRAPDRETLSALASALDSSSDAVLAAIARVRADRGANPRST
jgi:transcriptional regulator with XRE-family HTH domain